MKHQRTLAISICLNLALAGAAVCLLKKPVSLSPRESAATISETTTAPAVASLPATSNSPAPVTCVTNHFVWSKVEAEDFEQLALHLRAIGCPEKTVRDVVVARARRALEQAEAAADEPVPFWTAGLRRTQARQKAGREARLAREKITARLERVVGRDGFGEDSKPRDEFESQAIMRFMIGPMPDETFCKVAAKLARFGQRREELDSRTQGVWLDEDEAELAQLRAAYHRDLGALLSPAQLEEMTARMAMIPQMDRVKFEATDLTTAEVRQLGLLCARFTDPLGGKDSILGGNSLTDEQETELKAAQRQFLGEARFAQLERAADGDFKSLYELGRENNLPRETAVKVFDLRQLTAQEVEQLRQDNSLSDAARKQRLDQMQTEVQQAVLQLLGANASGQYLGRNGAWLTNLSGL